MANPWTTTLRRLAGDVLDFGYISSPGLENDTYERARLRAAVWKVRRAFEAGSEGGDLDEVVLVLTGVVRDGRIALLAWMDLLEEIVQVTERRFGTRSGHGEFKAQQAKAAFRRLLARSDTRSAAFVDLVGPSTVDLFTGWFIDVTVALLNKNETLWTAGTAAARVPLRTRVLARLVARLSALLDWLSARPALDPELYDEVERLAHGPGNPLVIVDRVIDLGEWLASNRDQTLALIDVVGAACDEVEHFHALGGSQAKQRYARNLVLATLDDAGLGLRGTGLEVAERVIDFTIDFVVRTNNKRGRYQHLRA